jgi:outer membrane protein
VFAADTCDQQAETPNGCVSLGKLHLGIGLGFGSRSNPIDTGRDIPLVLIPQISYYGKRFFLDNLDFGFTFYESDANTFNLIATPGYDRVFFYRRDLQNFFLFRGGSGASATAVGSSPPGQPVSAAAEETALRDRILARRRHVTYHVGPEWHFEYGRVSGQLDALYEVTGEHDGTEFRAAVAIPLYRSHGDLVASAGATWKSGSLVTYFYGEKGLYEGGNALNPFVKLSYHLPMTKDWSIRALAHVEWLDSSIARSPIIFEDYVTTVFAGVFYSF